ncbi:MAG: glycosyltransferase family protein [Acidimicrobiales bacterium]
METVFTAPTMKNLSPTVHGDFIRRPHGRLVISTAPPRFLLYSHDGVGLGHVRRNLTIAAAITEAEHAAPVLVVTGSDELESFSVPAAVDILRLPGLRKVDNTHYAARRLAVTPDDVLELRAALLRTAVERFRPDVVLADKHPVGVQGELLPALQRLRSLGGHAAVGLRDVIDTPARTRREWLASGADRHLSATHDLLLVYGQASVLDPLADCGLRADVIDRRCFCGYVVAGSATPRRRPTRCRPRVLAMTGGGEDGGPLLSTFIDAAHGTSWDVQAIAGPQIAPAVARRLRRRAARNHVDLTMSVPDLWKRLGDVDAVVCMGGYNSLVEALAAGVPTVCVPRVEPRSEQLLRANAFASRNLIRVVEPAELTATRLRTEVDAALATDRTALDALIREALDFGGAARAAAALLRLAAPRPSTARLPAGVGS